MPLRRARLFAQGRLAARWAIQRIAYLSKADLPAPRRLPAVRLARSCPVQAEPAFPVASFLFMIYFYFKLIKINYFDITNGDFTWIFYAISLLSRTDH
ncbi:hypothetical protein [Azotobacter beijerinckii]|uniref:hypothetical protein n=1 Tax=Azotobacter beijerinckii TaxID=170623 RepID=UPI0029537546|nr:hypothetical protein [Azotobacter beijerinckii]MDV7211256.1 hypothetical protein [Azotobacter beijerinckii]